MVKRGPKADFSGCEISSLVRSNAVLNTMMVDKAFGKMGGFGEALYARINICSSKEKMLAFPRRKWSSAAGMPSGGWLVIPGNGVTPGAHRWLLLLTILALCGSCSQINLIERKSMLSSP